MIESSLLLSCIKYFFRRTGSLWFPFYLSIYIYISQATGALSHRAIRFQLSHNNRNPGMIHKYFINHQLHQCNVGKKNQSNRFDIWLCNQPNEPQNLHKHVTRRMFHLQIRVIESRGGKQDTNTATNELLMHRSLFNKLTFHMTNTHVRVILAQGHANLRVF